VIGGEALAASPRPLTDVIATRWGGRAGDIVAFIAVASTVNTTLLILTAASRISYGMATRGSLPKFLGRVSADARAPWLASVAVLGPCVGFSLMGGIEVVASATDFAVYVVFLITNVSLIVLRFRRPNAPRGFRAPFSVGRVPLTAVLAIGSVLAMMLFLNLEAWLIGGATIAAGILLWWTAGRVDLPDPLDGLERPRSGPDESGQP
jgi:APA family basic amino acid/polyamine antiporter